MDLLICSMAKLTKIKSQVSSPPLPSRPPRQHHRNEHGVPECTQCLQFYGDPDKFVETRNVPLKWSRMKVDPQTGKREPDGFECNPCEASSLGLCEPLLMELVVLMLVT